MAETRQQVIDSIIRIGKQRGATRTELLSALNVGYTESRFSNSPVMTDHDSQGWRQERASLYKNPTNLKASINRYYDETKAALKTYGNLTPTELANKVQRGDPKYLYRWSQRTPTSAKILDSWGGPKTAPLTTPSVGGSARQLLLAEYLTKRGKPGALAATKAGLDALDETPTATTVAPTPTGGLGAGESYTSPGERTFKIGAKDAGSLAWWTKGSIAVPKWMLPQLTWAKAHGWDGQITNGYRSYEHQDDIYNRQGIRPAAPPGQSRHGGAGGTMGAVDVGNPQQLAKVLKGWTGGQTLVWAGEKDPPHFSIPSGGSY